MQMKKLLTGLLTAMVIAGICMSVNAYETASVTLNGQYIQFDQEPIIENGRTLVPMRKIFEAMGCDVFWYEESEMIDVYQDGENIMTLWVDDYDMWIPDKLITLDVPPKVINDRTLVPIRAISESIEAKVEWDEYTWTVIITYSKNTSDNSINTCSHSKTRMAYAADYCGYVEISSSTHTYRLVTDYWCDICGEFIDRVIEDTDEYHIFKNGVCSKCGYEKGETNTANSCKHTNTRKVISIDERTYKNTGSSSNHTTIEVIEYQCVDCGEYVSRTTSENTESHNFEDGVCTACGYVKENSSSNSNSSSTIQKPSSSSGTVTDYIDGAFMNIVVPPNQSICVPNTSEKTLAVKMDGVYNTLTRNSDGKVDSKVYNDKNKTGNLSIPKNGEAIIQNSGNTDLIVSVPSEYARYNTTSEKVYETVELNEGQSLKIECVNDYSDNVKFSNSNFRYVSYDKTKNSISNTSIDSVNNSHNITKNEVMIITANDYLKVYYCPATISCSSSSSAFREINVANGETIRIKASSDSKTVLYTEGNQEYDFVSYSSKGASDTKKGTKNKSQTINKGYYADFTNTSGRNITVTVTDLFSSIEYR